MAKFVSSAVVRLAGYASLAFAVVTTLLGAGVFWATRNALDYDLEQRIMTERVAVLREARVNGLATVIAARAAHGSQDMRYALVDMSGQMIAGQPMTTVPPLGWSNMNFVENDQPDPTRAVASRLSDGSLLVVGADPEAIEDLSAYLIQLFAIAFGLIAAISIGGALILGRLLARRLRAVSQTAEAIIAGDLKQRIPVGPAGDEFDKLAETLNRMLDRIQGLLDNLRQVSCDIAHDLRTPLTQVRQRLESALAGNVDAANMREAMAAALERSENALALFAGILAISEVEANSGFRMASMDLSALVEDVVDGYRPVIEDAGRPFAATIAPGIAILGNRQLLAQMLSNLLDNALRHTEAGTSIAVMLAGIGAEVQLSVADNGLGIPTDERELVLSRFGRLERSRSTPGHGLGLSLVAAVARAHGGQVRIKDNKPGVDVVVRLSRHR